LVERDGPGITSFLQESTSYFGLTWKDKDGFCIRNAETISTDRTSSRRGGRTLPTDCGEESKKKRISKHRISILEESK
jgi:hypothetical protein